MAEPRKGRELGRLLLAGLRNYVARSHAALRSDIDGIRKDMGKLTTVERMRGEIDARIAKARGPKGDKGEDGKSVSIEDCRQLIELAAREASLQAYRDTQAEIRRAIENMPKPKDGAGIDDIKVEQHERRVTISITVGDKVIEREFQLDYPIQRGLYQPGSKYERSDIVIFGGSAWIAQRDLEDEPPGSSDAWKLFVKKGKDGKSARQADEQ